VTSEPERSVVPSRADDDQLGLERSVLHLLETAPDFSAFRTLSTAQGRLLILVGAIFVSGFVLDPVATLVSVNALVTALYLVVLAYNLRILRAVLRQPPIVSVSDEEARAIPEEALPRYTVLVAAYREGEVIEATIRALETLEYPPPRLEVLLLLEAEDADTIAAAEAARPQPWIRIVAVPDAPPKTKPKALNYGLQLATGELVTVFDAEDRPDPLQLRRAAFALARLDPSVACLQAKLHYHNVGQNQITKWFSAEYVRWFASVLPALVALRAPVPLGGTSTHIRRHVLEDAGWWDPFNVTEDADLGIRLHRLGYRTQVLDSVTYEEANSDFINWVKQRSRWYKGFLQTWLVHMRHPLLLWRQLGTAGFVGFHVTIGATPFLALANPFFWLLTALWFGGGLHIVRVLFPAWIFYPALVSVVLGNFVALYGVVISVRLAHYPGLVIPALLSPLYWVFMSIAAIRAFAQLITAPSFWEKTLHGLDRAMGPSVAGPSR
jgi:cellulose synthase/poly-beta-1,6-N-acetylglucosamine synthase-like glycosyltransferase